VAFRVLELALRAMREAGSLRHGKRLDIVIFTGPGLQRWNPHTLETTGMGGTEAMAWEPCITAVQARTLPRVAGFP